MMIIGVDPGITGGISILKNKKVIEVYDTPTMIDGKKNKRQVNGSQVTNIIKEQLKNDDETRGEDLALKSHILGLVHGKDFKLTFPECKTLRNIFNKPTYSIHYASKTND